MVLSYEQLPDYAGRVAMVDGAFDPLHAGHIEYFKAAAALDLPLLCNLASDQYVATKHPPLLPEAQRAAVVDAIRFIAYTHINRFDTETVLEHLRPRYYVKGKDWEGRLPPRQVEICGRLGIGIVYLDTIRDSSSRLLQRFAQQSQNGAA
ncbi:MAG TPA: adenylyltransferase/cytidyltransferase family protein [Vicinamibacterales bacterium]|nr:adenylyltransferase/cytidyltransferase family protein [Vicinamibacterales bacterium]